MARRILWALAALLLVGGVVAASLRVTELAENELEQTGEWATLREHQKTEGSTRLSARLVQAELRRDEHALFEVCFQDSLQAEHWERAFDFLVWRPQAQKTELKVPLERRYLDAVKRSGDSACLQLGGGLIEFDGRYAVDAVWAGRELSSAVARVPMRGRILARIQRGNLERAIVLSIALGGLLGLLVAFSRPSLEAPRGPFSLRVGLVGILAALLLSAAVLSLPLVGPFGGLVRGLTLALVEVCVAFFFANRLGAGERQRGLALYAPKRLPGPSLWAAIACALLLNGLARLSMSVVPSTGEAPIEAFISWPSGALAFATIGMVVPLAEEIFFRGFVYGLIEPAGRAWAFVLTWVLFVAAHAHQTWGNWGALLGICFTGAVCTGLRAATGSTLVPAVAHLLYNLSLWVRF